MGSILTESHILRANGRVRAFLVGKNFHPRPTFFGRSGRASLRRIISRLVPATIGGTSGSIRHHLSIWTLAAMRATGEVRYITIKVLTPFRTILIVAYYRTVRAGFSGGASNARI